MDVMRKDPLKLDEENPRDWINYLWKIPQEEYQEPKYAEIALRERIKELNCLYGIARLAEHYYDSMDDLLGRLVDIIPLSWQHPESACARIVFQTKSFKSNKFKVTKWRQSSQIMMHNESVGDVTIFYLDEHPPSDEGPFLKEERVLLDEVAQRIGSIGVRMAAEKELQDNNRQLSLERIALQEANGALRAVLANIEKEKQSIYRDMQLNIEKVIMPILHTLSLEIPKAQRRYLEILRTSLEEITSPYISRFLHQYQSLTPTEISICNMIRNGLRSKEIAQIRNVSAATVNRHREHIRRKLNIAKNQVNLTSYLQSMLSSE